MASNTITFENDILSMEHVTVDITHVDTNITRVPYEPYDPSDPAHEVLDDFFGKIFPDEALRNWMWRFMASLLGGRNKEQKFYMWLGKGGNGKSQLVNLLCWTLGDYTGPCPATVLTTSRGRIPELMTLLNKRFIYMQEADENEPLNIDRIKEFVGYEAIIKAKTAMSCNSLPPINTQNDRIWQHINVIPFVSTFVPEGSHKFNPSNNIYHHDPELNNKLKECVPAFFGRLVHVYTTEYIHKDLNTDLPEIIRVASENYRNSAQINDL